MTHFDWLSRTLQLAESNILRGGGPFAALVVGPDGTVIGTGTNSVTRSCDPTAHAEVMAIRDACARLGTFQLAGCTLYSSCEPCPMCLGAIYWARPDAVYFAATQLDAAAVGFDDAFIYNEIKYPPLERSIPFIHLSVDEAAAPFLAWARASDKTDY